MNKFNCALVVTHIAFRKAPPYDGLEGPYSSVANSLSSGINEVFTCQLPISGFDKPVSFGPWKNEKNFPIPTLLGNLAILKYLTDFILVIFFAAKFSLFKRNQKLLVVGVDPLCALPLTILKEIFGFKLVFYSVDFNKTRFNPPLKNRRRH